MPPGIRFQINAPEVVAETIEDEVIVIHLKTGTYYSLVKAGAAVWQLLEAGASPEEAATALQSRYAGDPELISRSVSELVNALVAEKLVVESVSPGGSPGYTVADAATDARPREPFEAPRLEPYIDMQALIQLDPVHETDDRGWPSAAKQ